MESLKVKDYMNMRPVTFDPSQSLSAALDKLLTAKQIGGPVVDANRQVVGFLSEQDMIQKLIKVGYHCQDTHTVGECMREDVLTVSPDSSIIELADIDVRDKNPKFTPWLKAVNWWE